MVQPTETSLRSSRSRSGERLRRHGLERHRPRLAGGRRNHPGRLYTSDRSDRGYEIAIYSTRFTGPGTYAADGFLSESSAQRREDDHFKAAAGCTVTVGAAGDGLAGSFSCPSLPNRRDASSTVSLEGSFACGANALSTVIIALSEA
jgi:hypothetical protein